MPEDWLSPALQFLGSIAWPLVFVVAVVVFRVPLSRFIDEISEVAAFGTNAKRSGNLRSESLKDETRQELEESGLATDNLEGEDSPETESQDPGETLAGAVIGGNLGDSRELLIFVGRQIDANLRWARKNCDTTSSKLGAEIARSTYCDLRLGVRAAGFHLGGQEAVAGQTLRHAAPQVILGRVSAPDELIELVREARDFYNDVNSGKIQIDGLGAKNFITTVIRINNSLFQWVERQTSIA